MNSKPKLHKGDVSYSLNTTIKASLDLDMEKFQNGFMYMGITDVKVSEEGQEVGHIGVDVHGAAVHGHVGGRTWSIPMSELWPLFKEADERYLKGGR